MGRNDERSDSLVDRTLNFLGIDSNNTVQTGFNEELERDIRSCKHQCSFDRSNTSQNDNECCCKEGFRRSLDIISRPTIKLFIEPDSFRLIGEHFATSAAGTSISNIGNCNSSAITFSPAEAGLNQTTICDLVALQFSLIDPTGGTLDNLILNALFTRIIQRILPKMNVDKLCCKEESSCCCNQTKAAFLLEAFSNVNVLLNTSALTGAENPLTDVTVITVNNNVAWFIDSAGTVTIACLQDIAAFG